METIVIYCSENSPRLKFVSDWLFKERLQTDYKIITDIAEAEKEPFVIGYGRQLANGISVPDSGLLWQKGVQNISLSTGVWHDTPTFFAADDNNIYNIPFDIFSAIFFLLSRYEEYLPYKADKHGRYPPANSVLFRNGWLMRPLADEWVCLLRKQLQSMWKINLPATAFMYQPTYDIDIAYSHLYKGMKRIIGAYIKALVKMDIRQIQERIQVMKKKQKDPYDSFRWLRHLHKEYGYKPLYFILSCRETTAYDKNIHPRHPAMTRVIRNLDKEGMVGIHPSYYSNQGNVMPEEKKMLEEIIGHNISMSRQHYIKVKAPDTYRMLLKNGITEDYTMGYGSKLGFRAGTGNSFYWYDLENEVITPLRLHPFCFMDTTAHYESRMSVSQAFSALDEMSKILENTGSKLVTVFHNFSLGTSREWKGWRQAYEQFLQEKSQRANDYVHTGVDTI